jgi:hypothetical protein
MYLLLRNNKQSGPFSVDELKSMGLKAYDLVWSEGKSAAWRYPSEIEELSAFAPPVEEQPFDRFYKKPVSAVTSAVAEPAAPVKIIATTAEAVPAPAPAAPQYTGEPSTVPGKRIIYVTLPSGRNPVPAASAPSRELPREHPVVRELPKEPVRPVTPDPAHAAYASGPVHASPQTEDYSSQMPSLEEQLEAVSPRLSRYRKENRARILKPIAIVVAILALLAAGIFIGLSLNNHSASIPQRIAAKSPDKNTDQPIAHPVSQQLPASATIPSLTSATTEKPMDSVRTTANPVGASVPPVTKPIHAVTPKEHSASTKKGPPVPSVVKDSAAGMNPSPAVRRSDIVVTKAESKPVDKEAVRTSISSQVSVGANGYTVGTFGGVNDLQLTVTNRSVYPLDLVVVEVQYIQANKKVYKTENLYFRNIGAGSALMQEAPKSSRGIKVQYKITTISSRDLGLSYSGI